MTGITADVRFAMRALWRHRGFTIAVVLTLAVGVGVTSAVFHVYRAALLRPLAVSEPDRLVFLHRFETGRGYYSSASYPAFIDYRARAADTSWTLRRTRRVPCRSSTAGRAASRPPWYRRSTSTSPECHRSGGAYLAPPTARTRR